MGGECFEVGQGFNERALMAPYPASVPRIYHSSGRSAETLFAVEYWVLPNFVTFTSSSRIPIVLLMFCNYSYDMHIHEEIRIKTFNCGCEGVSWHWNDSDRGPPNLGASKSQRPLRVPMYLEGPGI